MKTTSKILLFLLIPVMFAYPQNVIFKSITTQEGLSSNDVNCLIQDKFGFIWIGTDNGLNRFDGTEFKIFRNKQNDSNSISDNGIWSLYEDRSGNIWIGTKGGVVNKYSPEYETIEHINLTEKGSTSNSITAILEDNNSSIWIGTYSQGLFNYNPSTKKIINWKYDPNSKNGLCNNYITSLLQDRNGYIWISTYNGLNRLNPDNIANGFTVFFSDNSNIKTISDNLVWKISQSKLNQDLLWVGTANGLCSYDITKGIFHRLPIKAAVPSQFSNSFSSVVEQNEFGKDVLWASTYSGLFRIDLNDYSTEQFTNNEKSVQGLIGNQIDQLLIDQSGVMWVATEEGLNYHSLKTHKFNKILSQAISSPYYQELLNADIKGIVNFSNEQYYIASTEALYLITFKEQQPEIKKINELNNLNLWSIEKGLNNDLWIGTYGNGLIHFDLINSKKTFVNIKSPTFRTSAFNYIKALKLSTKGILWIGFWGGGLAAYDIKNGNYKIWIFDSNNDKSLSHNDLWSLKEDRLGRLWIGTNGGGLNLFVPTDGGSFFRWQLDHSNNNSLINNSIQSITEIPSENNSETILLIGTENGISKATIKNITEDLYNVDINFSNLSNDIVLIENSIKGILADNDGLLWISTSSGLIQFNPKNGTRVNFNTADGLNSNIFNSGAFSRSKSGLMIFGTVKGPVIFNPKEINISEYEPKIIFTDFQIFNQSVIPGNNSPLKTNISVAKEINLSHDQNAITFKFSALDFNASDQIQYLYKMEGFDKDWIKSGPLNLATYTNLDPGSYTLIVKGTNSDGFWSSKSAKINIIISPPVWKTVWAYAIYVIIISLGLFAIRKFELSRTQLRNELKLKDLEAKKIREIENMKSRFFANLSHEFRTPLMLIKGPAEQLLNKTNVNQTEQIKLIHRNSEKLQNLIDQLLELTQLEAASIELKAKKENLVAIVRGIFFSFSALAESRKISLKFNSVKDQIVTWIDRDKIEKILNNLLSNAFKFTPEHGIINIEIINTTIDNVEYSRVSIKDSGIGIPDDQIDKIFDRFFQVDDSSKRAYSGSGIGLSLVKELVDLHNWKIFVESKEGVGTEFVLQIPLNDNYLKNNQKIIEEKLFDNSEISEFDSPESILAEEKSGFDDKEDGKVYLQNKYTILIVEDSEDVRNYIKDILKNDYNILVSENGGKGLDDAFEMLPDLIISDVMMPEMDGIEFCKRIKSDWRTSHIPVILLTAKAASENKIEGLETGADDYITKPFNFRELIARIKNLLEQRQKLRAIFGKDVNFKPENITPNKADQEFLQNAIGIVEKNISDSKFDSEYFAKQVFLSRSQLHRKIQSITGQSTGEFIRTVRLKKAAGLILEKKLSVTQISFEVGFNSPSHFTKAFKQLFDCLPSEFIDRNNS
jgi:signal transduction histidine kinase/ligand-binding sensor domain-containing protein/DNA-binding response OmpR family regulator